MNNMEIWDKVKRPPSDALKQITGGRLSGMTDIKPQWRLQIMTEVFGPIGIGWWYEIDKTWSEKTDDGQVSVYVIVNVFIENSKPITGLGGSMLYAKESKGMHHSDECFKMALTDALSVAMKQIGVGADIYMGKWDGSKFKDTPKDKIKPSGNYDSALSAINNAPDIATVQSYIKAFDVKQWKDGEKEKLLMYAQKKIESLSDPLNAVTEAFNGEAVNE